MAIFTVHVPPAAAGAHPAPEKIVFLRDGFSWGAFFFGPFWLWWNRAYLAALLWTALIAIISVIIWKLHLPGSAMSPIGTVMGLWLGFEGNQLIAWTLRRRGYVDTDVVIGDSSDEAEAAFFHRWRPLVEPEILAPERGA